MSSGAIEGHRLVALRFDGFGWTTLEAAAAALDDSIEELIAAACGHLVVESRRGRPAARVLRLPGRFYGKSRELELALPPRIWAALEGISEEQHVELRRVIEHASLLYVRDLESGAGLTLDEDPPEDAA